MKSSFVEEYVSKQALKVLAELDKDLYLTDAEWHAECWRLAHQIALLADAAYEAALDNRERREHALLFSNQRQLFEIEFDGGQ